MKGCVQWSPIYGVGVNNSASALQTPARASTGNLIVEHTVKKSKNKTPNDYRD